MKLQILGAITLLFLLAMTQVFATTKKTLCLTESALLHSVNNKVQASTSNSDNWILGGITNSRSKLAKYPLQLKSACYKITKISTKKIILGDREVTSKFFKLELDGNSSLQAEKRESKKVNKSQVL
jgi:hypothetical protein